MQEAEVILRKIYPAEEVDEEIRLLKQSIEKEKAESESIGKDLLSKLKGAWANKVVRRGLYAGITVQVAQQFVGINTVMYYSPSIVQFAGFASNRTALALSLVTSGLNAVGTIFSMCLVDRYGRRRLMLISMVGIICCLLSLTIVFSQAAAHAPAISSVETSHFGANSTCSAYQEAQGIGKWTCTSCLKADCAFCSNAGNEVSRKLLLINQSINTLFRKSFANSCSFFMFNIQYHPGACLADTKAIEGLCTGEHRTYFKNGCPSKFGFLAVVFLGLYIVTYAPGIGTIPWILNSEIYPLKYRGLGGGIAAVSNWTANLIVSETFLTLTEALGSSGTFLLFAGFTAIGLLAIYLLVPETKGLPFEEVEKMLQNRFKPKLLGGGKKQTKDVESRS